MDTSKVIYPRYTREQNLACKLSDEEISLIKKLNKKGNDKRGIARLFNVTTTAIRYWCMSDAWRKNLNSQPRQRDIKKKREGMNKAGKRKRQAMGKELNKYRDSTDAKARWIASAKCKEYHKKYLKEWMSKPENRERVYHSQRIRRKKARLALKK